MRNGYDGGLQARHEGGVLPGQILGVCIKPQRGGRGGKRSETCEAAADAPVRSAGNGRLLGVTAVLVSHDIPTVAQFATHALCLRNGSIQKEGHPKDVLNAESVQETFGQKRMG